MGQFFQIVLYVCLSITAFAYSNTYQIESVAYESVQDRTHAHIFLNNGYEFIFSVDRTSEHELFDLENDCNPGTFVHLSNWEFTPMLELSLEGRKYKVSISKQTKGLLPRIEYIEVDQGWIYNDYYVHLDDGSCWKLAGRIKGWETHDRILVQTLYNDSIALINIDAPFCEKTSESSYGTVLNTDGTSSFVIIPKTIEKLTDLRFGLFAPDRRNSLE